MTLAFSFTYQKARSERLLYEEGTSVAPPQRLRTHIAAPPVKPIPGSRERVENRTMAESRESVSDESSEETGNDESNNEANNEGNDEDNDEDNDEGSDESKKDNDDQRAQIASGYVLPHISSPLISRGVLFFLFFFFVRFCSFFQPYPPYEGFIYIREPNAPLEVFFKCLFPLPSSGGFFF
jgi:hypothetical protein